MAESNPVVVGKGLRFTWYKVEPGIKESGGLGIRMSRDKKTRSFFAVLPVSDVRDLHRFLGKCLKKK